MNRLILEERDGSCSKLEQKVLRAPYLSLISVILNLRCFFILELGYFDIQILEISLHEKQKNENIFFIGFY